MQHYFSIITTFYYTFLRSHSAGTDRWPSLRVCEHCMRGPQGSVLGALKFCLYMLPLNAILRFHKIGYQVYTDDTQINVSFKCDDPSQALDKINVCVSDIRKCYPPSTTKKTS